MEPPVQPLFLFSLPRAGSTLSQRILAAHPAIFSDAEGWLLLPHLLATHPDGYRARYRQDHAARAIADFCSLLPNGSGDYAEALRHFTLSLYRSATPPGHRYFLDKTPRYHLIVEDILALFPQARFVFLWRNPLAVAASMIETWGDGKWNLHRMNVDLFEGLPNLVDAFEAHRRRVVALRYEDLIADPLPCLQRVFAYLDLPHDPTVLDRFGDVEFRGRMVGPPGQERYDTLSPNSLSGWTRTFANPLRRRWAHRYLDWLGAARLRTMGYDGDQLRARLEEAPLSWAHTLGDAVRRARYRLRLHRFFYTGGYGQAFERPTPSPALRPPEPDPAAPSP